MKRLSVILIIVGLICLGGTFNAYCSELSDNLKAYCADEWPHDYEMQAHCYNKQGNARMEYSNKYYEPYKDMINRVQKNKTRFSDLPVELQIVGKCLNEWKTGKPWGFDYEMVLHCCDKQFESARRLGVIK